MLLQLRVENHRSIRDEQTLTFTAAPDVTQPGVDLLQPSGLDDAVLPAIALYGANASGKTNVLHALALMQRAVLDSHRRWEPGSGTPREPFALGDGASRPSRFEVDLWVDAARHRYGFALSDARVEEEWLFAWPSGRKQSVFERRAADIAFAPGLRGDPAALRGFMRPDSLFLSVAAQNNQSFVGPVFSWFRRLAVVMRPGRHDIWAPSATALAVTDVFPGRQLELLPFAEEREQNRESLLRLLRAADTGIVDIELQDRGPRARPVLLFKHRSEKGKDAWLPLEVESAGTVTLLEIGLRLIHALRHGGVLCIDELEASLHPTLAHAVLRLFQSRAENPAAGQLLFTTHDTNLLGPTLGPPALRRDQVWFAEKDRDGATHLYPLTDFHSKGEENVERGYLQGRYGAVPFLEQLVSGAQKA